jgi:hypothetical protein
LFHTGLLDMINQGMGCIVAAVMTGQSMKFRNRLILTSTAMLSLLWVACAGETPPRARPAAFFDQAASTVSTEASPTPSLPLPSPTQRPTPIAPTIPPPTPEPTATPIPLLRFQLAINGAVPQPDQNVIDVANGSVSIRPPAGSDGKYDSGAEVILEGQAASPAASFSWNGVDRQNGSGAVVTMDHDRSVMVEIQLPLPTPPPAEVPTPTATPTPEPTATVVQGELQFGWIEGTVRERLPRSNFRLADVAVEGQLSGHGARTDSEGRYSLFLPVGMEFITFTSAKTYYDGVKAYYVRPGVTARMVDFAFNAGDLGPCLGKVPFTVEGVVLADSVPVNGARVWLWNTNHETTTDEGGHYSIQKGCGELILAELGDLRGGTLVEPKPDSVIQAGKINLSSR